MEWDVWMLIGAAPYAATGVLLVLMAFHPKWERYPRMILVGMATFALGTAVAIGLHAVGLEFYQHLLAYVIIGGVAVLGLLLAFVRACVIVYDHARTSR